MRDRHLNPDPGTYVCLLQALLGLEGVAVWGEWLDSLNNEEYEVACPSCGTNNFGVFGRHGHFTTLESRYVSKPDAARVSLLPKRPQDLGPLGSRLHEWAT